MKNELSDMHAGAIAFATLPEDRFSSVLKDLGQLPLAFTAADMVFDIIRGHDLLSSVTDDDDVSPGSFILFALYRMADRGGKRLTKIIDGFIESATRECAQDPNCKELITSLRRRLDQLSQLDNAITSIKANLLGAERDRVLLSSRIVTDVRPVLDDEASSPSMLIIHTLRLDVRENGEKRTLYVSLDKQDIEDLKEHLERATRKAELVSDSLKAGRTKIIE